jgi:hypothetical protein
MFGAIIVPASDADARITPPRGYLFIGRIWDKDYLEEHAAATGFEINPMNENELATLEKLPSMIYILKPLKDSNGKLVTTLIFSAEDPLSQEMSFFRVTHSGGNIEISAISGEKNIEITVTDNGIGMDEKTIGQLFKIESNLTTYGTANEKGTEQVWD